MPLFACFSTEDIHSSRRINANVFKQYNQKHSFGYYECLDGNGFFSYWINRMLVLKEGNKSPDELEIVRLAIIKVLGADGCGIIADMSVRPNIGKVFYQLSDGREVEADLLSDGYRRIVNIVTDLAFRCSFLNRGIYGMGCCAATKGTVLIDEIDMHLHPSLQAKILSSLHNAFAGLQFIVTTHAPMVMSGVRNDELNAVYRLNYNMQGGYSIRMIDTYGMDVSTITRGILNLVPRVKEVEDKLSQLFDYIDCDKYQDARKLLMELKSKYSEGLPELVQAEAMLNCSIIDE